MVSEIIVKIVAVVLLIAVAVVLILGIKTLFKGNEDKNILTNSCNLGSFFSLLRLLYLLDWLIFLRINNIS